MRGFLAERITAMPLKRMITVFILLSTIMLLFTLVCFYYSFYNASLETSYEYMGNILAETGSHIEILLNDVSASMLVLAYSENVYNEFINVSDVRKFETGKVIRTMLNSLSDTDKLIHGIVIRLKDGQTLSSNNISSSTELYQVFNSIVRDYSLSEPFQDMIFTRCYAELNSGDIYFACLVPIYNTAGGARSEDRFEGAYVALCSAGKLVDTQSYSTSLAQSLIIVSENDLIIYSNNNDLATELMQAISNDDGKNERVRSNETVFQIRTGTVSSTGWNIVCAVPDLELRSGLNQIRTWGIILTFSVVLVQILMGYILRRSIVRPLSSIVKQIHNVGTKEGPASMLVPDSSEIGILAADIKDMLIRIERMNMRVINSNKALYQAENKRLAVQIMFLQAQINPHFLYNNLECIRGMAAGENIEGVRSITSAMASIYRYCISPGQMVTIKHELEMARRFFDIIVLRYGKRYDFHIDVAEEIFERPIPKMTLQPILENTFLHGLSGIESGGSIVIHGEKISERETLLSVIDNGHGMDNDLIEKMNQKLSNFDMPEIQSEELRIGIQNVNNRIQLIFGKGYGVKLKPNTPKGLCVEIRIGIDTKISDVL